MLKLDEIGEFTQALNGIADAVNGVEPKVAAKALRMVLETFEPPAIEVVGRLLPQTTEAYEADGLKHMATRMLVAKTEPVDPTPDGALLDEVASKLCAHGIKYAEGLKLAKQAIEEKGEEASKTVLVSYARSLHGEAKAPSKRDHAERIERSAARRIKDKSPVVEDAIDYVRRHPGCSIAEYSAKAGIAATAARSRMAAAIRGGAIERQGSKQNSTYHPLR